jgi:hypothetical protein
MSRRMWLYFGIATEVFHVWFIFAVLLFGRWWLPGEVVTVLLTLTVMGQIIFLWCPLTVFSFYCFKQWDESWTSPPSPTLYLYRRFGWKVGIPVFIVLIAISLAVGSMRHW